MSEIEEPTPPVPSPEPIPSPDPAPPPNPGPEPPELTPLGSTPERQQDPGEHGYGGTHQEKLEDNDGLEGADEREHPEDPGEPWPGEERDEDE
jgi:hypothetical protein